MRLISIKNFYQLASILYLSIGYSINYSYAENLPKLDLKGFQQDNGAITIGYNGDFVDPYFAMRALLVAQEEGMDIKQPALRWINWLIKKQRADGRFDRYCQKGKQYLRCMDADADDVDMILWAQLLTLFTDSPEMPGGYQQSYNKSLNYLENELYNNELGIYIVNKKSSVGLFMDNVEVAHALFQLAALKRQQNNLMEAAQFELRASNLVESIERVFGGNSYYEVSTQPNETKNFYPGGVAQIYPWIFSVPLRLENNQSNFVNWYNDWNISIGLLQSDFAWGMIAIAARKAGNESFVEDWLKSAKDLRPSSKWNVLEEVSYQLLISPIRKDNLPINRH